MQPFSTEKINISPDYKYLYGNYIREYDISKCNINMMMVYGVITEKLYNHLYNSDKQYREIYIGNLIRNDKNVYKVISDGIIKYRNMLFMKNNITESDILTIKNDAVFVINKNLEYTEFDKYIKFANKSTYTSFFKINNLELYYNINTDVLDIKGMSDHNIQKHHSFIEFLKTVIYLIELGETKQASDIIMNCYYDYVSGNIDLSMLRNFDIYSDFSHKDYNNLGFDVPIDSDPNNYNFNTNIKILMEFNKIINSILLSKI